MYMFHWYGDMLLHAYMIKIKQYYNFFVYKCYEIYGNKWGDDIIIHSFAYRIVCSRTRENCNALQFRIFFIFNLIFIKFSLFCLKSFYIFFLVN